MDLTLIILFLLFMSVVFGLYFLFPLNKRYIVLLAFSLLFYAVYSKFLTVFLIITILTVYFAGISINKLDEKFDAEKKSLEKPERKLLKAKYKKKKNLITAVTVILNLGFIAALKYSGMFAGMFDGIFSWFKITTHFPVLKIGLPLGISYYTLSSIGYLIDVNRGKYKAENNILKVALFICFFPQMLEGPFASFDKLAPQLSEGHAFDLKNCSSGVLSVIWGFFKKVVIADRLAIVAGEIFAHYSDYNGLFVIIGVLAFTFQLYAEFSGIIDIAAGISKMFGIELAKNFEQPFFSKNVSEFWRRWHISLGVWFREYVFYPVSMSKPFMALTKKLHGKVSPFFETFIPSLFALFFVWFSNGLWHGASVKYIVYGLYYYVIMMIGMCIEPLFKKIFAKAGVTEGSKKEEFLNVLRIIRTFIIINIGMLLFRAPTLGKGFDMFLQIFKGGRLYIPSKVIDVYDVVLCFIGVTVLLVSDALKEYKINVKEYLTLRPQVLRLAVYVSASMLIIIFGAYGQGYVPVDPIYGGF